MIRALQSKSSPHFETLHPLERPGLMECMRVYIVSQGGEGGWEIGGSFDLQIIHAMPDVDRRMQVGWDFGGVEGPGLDDEEQVLQQGTYFGFK